MWSTKKYSWLNISIECAFYFKNKTGPGHGHTLQTELNFRSRAGLFCFVVSNLFFLFFLLFSLFLNVYVFPLTHRTLSTDIYFYLCLFVLQFCFCSIFLLTSFGIKSYFLFPWYLYDWALGDINRGSQKCTLPFWENLDKHLEYFILNCFSLRNML